MSADPSSPRLRRDKFWIFDWEEAGMAVDEELPLRREADPRFAISYLSAGMREMRFYLPAIYQGTGVFRVY